VYSNLEKEILQMNALYADPVEINIPFEVQITSSYPAKKFFIFCNDGKKRAMSGTLAGLASLDASNNCFLDFHIYWNNPRSVMVLRIRNIQSIYFDNLLGRKNYQPIGYLNPCWKINCIVTYDDNDFWVHFPCGILKAKNVTS
jgi:hypothetical protein